MADSLVSGAYTPDSYLANTVLTSALLNNDNTLEASSFNIILQMIGDVDGETAATSSPTMINSLGRAIGSMGILNPVFPMSFSALSALYASTGEQHTGPVNKIMLDFVPTGGSITHLSINGNPSVHASNAATRADLSSTYPYYWEAGTRYIELYDTASTSVVVRYTPSSTFANSFYEHQAGLNTWPTLADVANGKYVTLNGSNEITFVGSSNIQYIIDTTSSTPSSGVRANFVKLTASIPYEVPQFIKSAADQSIGGGFGGLTIPSTAISLFLIDGTTVKNKVNGIFTFTRVGDVITVAGDAGVLASLQGQKLLAVFSQGEALSQAVAYAKNFVLKHDHGANGGQPISALDITDMRPGSMGLANLADSTIPMHITPQTLHRGGFTDTAPNIDGNAFIGDLRLSNGNGTNTTLLSSYTPGSSLNLYLNALSTDWATLTGGTKVGKLSSINGGNLDYALFGNGYSIFDDRVTIGPNGILDVVGVEPTDDTSTSTHGINFFNNTGAVKNKIALVSKTIHGSATEITQFAGIFNFSLTSHSYTGIRRRALTTESGSKGYSIFLGVDNTDTGVVKDYGAISFHWMQDGVGGDTEQYLALAAKSSVFDGSTHPWEGRHVKIFNHGGIKVDASGGGHVDTLWTNMSWRRSLTVGAGSGAHSIVFDSDVNSRPIGIGVSSGGSDSNIYVIRSSTANQEPLYPIRFDADPTNPRILLTKYDNGWSTTDNSIGDNIYPIWNTSALLTVDKNIGAGGGSVDTGISVSTHIIISSFNLTASDSVYSFKEFNGRYYIYSGGSVNVRIEYMPRKA